MQISQMKKLLKAALATGHDNIHRHISDVTERGLTSGIESAFARAFEAKLSDAGIAFQLELPLEKVGVKQFYPGRERGRVDCLVTQETDMTALEYKATRMPRKQSSPKFDMGQILVDYMRLRSGSELSRAYIVAFVYGPLVKDCSSDGSLYRRFHNPMFVDQALTSKLGEMSKEEKKAVSELEWNAPWSDQYPPDYAAAVKVGDLGAICISVFDP